MTHIIKKFFLFILGLTFLSPTISFASKNELYRWQDDSGKWHYTRIPPNQDDDSGPKKVEVANDSRTIIFGVKQFIIERSTTPDPKQEARSRKAICQATQSIMMDTARSLHRDTDQLLQEKSITLEEFTKEKQAINKLEEIATDLEFTDSCIDDFVKKPQIKAISECIIKSDTYEDRTACLKELPQT